MNLLTALATAAALALPAPASPATPAPLPAPTPSSTPSPTPATPAAVGGNAELGCALYQARCAACHSLDYNGVGPAHRGLFGRKAARVAGFAYSVNALPRPPDFVVFTGDLTHTTDDPAERRRLTEFKAIAAGLQVKTVRFMPGEHDAALDRGAAYKEHFGETFFTFDHRGVHFIALDNVSVRRPHRRRATGLAAGRPGPA